MDFGKIDFKKFLKAALNARFEGIEAEDFESFLIKLFSDNGYLVSGAKREGVHGIQLILEKENVRTGVQIRRMAGSRKVGVQDVNLAIGAAQSHRIPQVMIVTNTYFSDPAIELCKLSGVFTWDWEILKEAIYTTYRLDDDGLFDPTEAPPVEEDDFFELSVLKVAPDQYLNSGEKPFTEVLIGLENNSGRNVNVFLDTPVLLRYNNKQYSSAGWIEKSFQSGIIYNGAGVEVGCYFPEENLPEVRRGDKILIPVSVPALSLMKTYSVDLMPVDERCFVVTYAFQRNSLEYHRAIAFRDNILMTRKWGRVLVVFYYAHSPAWVRWFEKHPDIHPRLKRMLNYLLRVAEKFERKSPRIF